MLRNITRPEWKTETHYELRFFYDSTGGFAFPCNADGMLIHRELSGAAFENYKYCMEHPERFPYAFNKLAKWTTKYREPKYGFCSHCGHKVYLENQYMGACQCPCCDQWYNLFGEEILPPGQWDENLYEDD